jgi:hypothetical protein
MMLETDPEKILEMAIDIPLELVSNDRQFWSLMQSVKLQHTGIYQTLHSDKIFEPVILKVTQALDELGWEDPELEAMVLMIMIEGLMGRILKQDIEEVQTITDYIKAKYI